MPAKHYFKLLLLFILTNPCIVNAKKLQAFMSYSTFTSPATGPYIETYLIVGGQSVVYTENGNGKYQGTIEITLIFKQNDTIKQFSKYNLKSPEVTDTNDINFNFIDQQRFLLANGTYEVDIKIADINDNAVPYEVSETIEIFYPDDKITVSGIELIESFNRTDTISVLSKSGYDLIPYILNYYPENIKKLTYYCEIYNSYKILGEDVKYLISTSIETYETEQLFGEMKKFKKETSKEINVVFGEFDISQLPTGNYNLVIEVIDQTNKILAFNRLYFRRNNPNIPITYPEIVKENITNTFAGRITNYDTLRDYIRCLSPISTETERLYAGNILKAYNIENMQTYFYQFWTGRNKNNPEGEWLMYKIEVDKVNAEYSTSIKRGYETDRGRVYLQYGAPNSINKSINEPSAYPYEIWHYYQLATQKNKKFVFCNTDLATNDYNLIHSDAIGEIYDYKWKQRIYSRNTSTNDPDIDGVIPHWGEKSDDYYRNPR